MRCAMQMAVGAVLLAIGWAAAQEPAPGGAAERERVEFFERRVRPLLVEKCQPCHGPQKQESGLRLDSRAALLAGGDGGPVVAPGDPQRSRLLQVVRREDDLQMPPDDPLEPAHIAALTRWIEAGAAWPADEDHSGAGPDEDQRLRSSQHWAFQPLVKPPLPEVPRADGAQNPVDLFVLARQRAAGVAAAPRADAHTLIRRASFDLLGLPPTPEQVDAFVHDAQRHPAAAFDRLVDRLLASPRYGERWGRHWLDVARYADNKGYVFFEDKKYPWAYTYRDYVIAALNADLPYDRFVLEQLAADQLAASPPQASLAAMGFLTLGGHFMNNTHDIIDDRIDVVTRGLLGLTVTCARCHDHKYDAIPQRDYYSLYGVFRSGYEPTLPPLLSPPPDDEQYRKFVAEMDQRLGALVDFVTARHRELVNDARTRIADYLLAAHRRRGKPPSFRRPFCE